MSEVPDSLLKRGGSYLDQSLFRDGQLDTEGSFFSCTSSKQAPLLWTTDSLWSNRKCDSELRHREFHLKQRYKNHFFLFSLSLRGFWFCTEGQRLKSGLVTLQRQMVDSRDYTLSLWVFNSFSFSKYLTLFKVFGQMFTDPILNEHT